MRCHEYITTDVDWVENDGRLEISSSRFNKEVFVNFMKKIQQGEFFAGFWDLNNMGKARPNFPVKSLDLIHVDFGTRNNRSFSLGDVLNKVGDILKRHSCSLNTNDEKLREHLEKHGMRYRLRFDEMNIFISLKNAVLDSNTSLKNLNLSLKLDDGARFILTEISKLAKKSIVIKVNGTEFPKKLGQQQKQNPSSSSNLIA